MATGLHRDLEDAELHPPKGAGTATAGQVYVADGTGGGSFQVIPAPAAGSVDHGDLSGLTDDDHPQYLTEARHDALPADNPHGVTAAQTGADPAGTASAEVSAHEGAANPHPVYLTGVEHDAIAGNPHGVTAMEVGADPAGTAAAAQAASIAASAASLALHVADSDPHSVYLTDPEHSAIAGNPHGVTAAEAGADPAGTAAAAIAAHEGAADPHPVYITEAELPALIAAYNDNQSFEFTGSLVGSQTANVFTPRFSQVVTFAHVGSAYLFRIPFLFSMNTVNTDIRVRAEVDNVAVTAEVRAELQDSAGGDGGTGSGTDQRYARVLLFEFTPTAATHTIDLEFAASTVNDSPTIYETALYLGRHQL